MPEVSEIDKCRAKRKVAKASVTRNMNRVRELISSDGSVSKVRQFAKGVEEGRTKARDLTKELEELDPASVETDGSWLEEVEFDVNEVLGEVAEYLLKSESPSPNEQSSIASPTAQNNDENTETVNDSMSGKRTGLKGVEIPSFDGKPNKWPTYIEQVKAFLRTNTHSQGPQGNVSSVVVEDETRIFGRNARSASKV
ncbi:Hypothetical predicted protein [Paramuricea clavata]|uniref:Uncharacterized protein n=1 Tax=Paramuricea clavata TaxID=317549 RepID=A0A7D9K6E1_PARCT|nr:Hypothetical predicted protein [Paramuricea clavata]